MAVADDLAGARAALQMINPAPYNAEAPPEALAGEITPIEFHYVRSNFPLPAHDGTLEVGGAVENPLTLTLDDLRAMPAHERAVTLECAGNGRLEMRPLPTGEPWGDYAVSTARWKGALLHEVLATGASGGRWRRRALPGRRPRRVPPQPRARRHRQERPELRPRPAARTRRRPGRGDPDRLRDERQAAGSDHGSPFRIIVPHWYAVASVKWLKRIDVLTEPYAGEFQTGHYMYEWADRPAEPVDIMRVRARITAPAAGSTLSPGTCTVRGKAWSGTGPVTRVEVSLTGEGEWHAARLDPPYGPIPLAGLVIRLGRQRHRTPHPPRPGHRRGRQRPARGPAVEPARLRQQRHRGHLRRRRLTWPATPGGRRPRVLSERRFGSDPERLDTMTEDPRQLQPRRGARPPGFTGPGAMTKTAPVYAALEPVANVLAGGDDAQLRGTADRGDHGRALPLPDARRAAVISSRGSARCHAPAFRAPAPSRPRGCRRRLAMRSRMFAIPAPTCVSAGSNPAPESQTVKSSAPPVSERSTETGTGPACLAALSSAARHEKYTAISTSGRQRRTPLACTVTGRPDRSPAETSAAANPKEVSSAG